MEEREIERILDEVVPLDNSGRDSWMQLPTESDEAYNAFCLYVRHSGMDRRLSRFVRWVEEWFAQRGEKGTSNSIGIEDEDSYGASDGGLSEIPMGEMGSIEKIYDSGISVKSRLGSWYARYRWRYRVRTYDDALMEIRRTAVTDRRRREEVIAWDRRSKSRENAWMLSEALMKKAAELLPMVQDANSIKSLGVALEKAAELQERAFAGLDDVGKPEEDLPTVEAAAEIMGDMVQVALRVRKGTPSGASFGGHPTVVVEDDFALPKP